jgi:hypothetical protein
MFQYITLVRGTHAPIRDVVRERDNRTAPRGYPGGSEPRTTSPTQSLMAMAWTALPGWRGAVVSRQAWKAHVGGDDGCACS